MKATVALAIILTVNSLLARDIHIKFVGDVRKALKEVQPGDVLVVREGVFTNAQWKFEATGTAEKPITLRAQTPGKTILTGLSWIKIGGEHLIVSGFVFRDGACPGGSVIAFRSLLDRPARNCRVTDCAVIGYNPTSPDGKSYWVSLYGVSNRIDHCRFEGKNDGGPTLTVWLTGDQPNCHLIDHNYFLHRPKLGRNGGETMRVGDSATSMHVSRTVVEHNLFEDCSGEAEYISNKSCENIYRYNTIVKSKGALVLRHGNRNTVEGNWFFGHHVPGTGGVRIIGEDQRVFNNYFDSLDGTDFESTLPFVNGIPNSKLNEYFRVQRAVVAFNTLVDCKQNITFGIGVGKRNRAEPPEDCVIANNIVVGTNGPLVKFQDQPVNLKWQGNIFFGATNGLPAAEGIKITDPGFKRGGDGIVRPQNIIAASGDFSFVTEDIEGRSRAREKTVGCIQSSEAAPHRKPVSVADVGPLWQIKP